MSGQHSPEFARAIEPVARKLLGQPNQSLSKPRELRFGSNGSMSVDLDKGIWSDHEAGEGGGTLALVQRTLKLPKEAALSWMRENGHLAPRQDTSQRRIVASYDYVDGADKLLFQVVRYEPKDFRQRRPNGSGWSWKLQGVRRVLFRLPAVRVAVKAAALVYIAEGEKAVMALEQLGVVATCSPGGAGKWRPEYAAELQGANVVILPDNDDPGRKHAAEIELGLRGVASRVRTLSLPGLGAKGDAADWIATGGTRLDLEQLAHSARAPDRHDEAADVQAIDGEWLSRCQTDDRGRPLGNVANAMMALRGDAALSGLFAYDEMARTTMLLDEIPACSRKSRRKPGQLQRRPIRDVDVTALQEWLQLAGLPRMARESLHQAVALRATEHSYHPVRTYLDGLVWDRVPRLRQWLISYLGAEENEYVEEVGRMFLISMVARIYRPGAKVDYMIVLESEQGRQKSSACAVLADEWFSDSLPDVTTGKEASQHLRGKWLIEVAEMSAMSRAESAALKAFITRQVEQYRPSYGREEVYEPRQVCFIGTTNKSQYLRDETGGRRFWPVKVGQVDLGALRHDRDQLFAEAVVAYRDGARWWPELDFEATHIRPEQEARFEGDAWEDAIRDHLARHERVTVLSVAQSGLGIDTPKLSRTDQNRIMNALRHCGWDRGERGHGGVRYWTRVRG